MPEYQENSIVQTIERFTEAVYRLTLQAPNIAAAAQPGQFVMVACGPSRDPLLRRPFSIHQTGEDGTLQLFLKVVGRGTRLLSELRPGDQVSLIGPLGRGFRLSQESPVCLIGGGIGIAPLLFLAHAFMRQSCPPNPCHVLLGSRTAPEIEQLAAEFTELGCHVQISTDDGSSGYHGLVSDLLAPYLPSLKKVCVCGPFAMMATVAELCRDATVPCDASLEAHMACGLGACLGCTIPGTDALYKHVCKHGPVFNAEEVLWKR